MVSWFGKPTLRVESWLWEETLKVWSEPRMGWMKTEPKRRLRTRVLRLLIRLRSSSMLGSGRSVILMIPGEEDERILSRVERRVAPSCSCLVSSRKRSQ